MIMKKIGIRVLVFILVLVCVLISIQMNVKAEENLGVWTAKASMPTARYFLGVAEVNNKIYAIGGYRSGSTNVVEEYDLITDEWKMKESMPTLRHGFGVVEVNNKIYAIGGRIGIEYINKVEEYNPITDKWITKTSLATARGYLGVAEVNNKIYAIGGSNNSGNTNIVEEYNPVTDEWTIKASMPTSRHGFGVVEVDNKIYAIGGSDSSGYTNMVEEYNPITDKWITKTNMPTERRYLGVVEANGKIYAIGGINSGGSTNIVEEYDPITNQWRTVGNMPTPRHGLGVINVNSKVYSIGGYADSEYTNIVEEFTPPYTIQISSTKINTTTNTSIQASWTSSGELDGATYTLAAFDENDNQTKENLWTSNLGDTITGLNSSTTYKLKVKAKNSYENITDWYDIGTATTLDGDIDRGSWTTKSNMATERFGLKAIAANKKIYSIGGFNSNATYSNIVEQYNPNTDVWTTKANMPTPRRFLGLAEYNNKIYAVGGFNDNGMSNKVEEYDVVTDQWKEVSSMPTSRHNLGVTTVEDKVYAIGGYAGAGATNIVEEYDIKSDTWIVKSSMSTPRYGLEAVEVNNKIYAIGGYFESESINVVEEYDIATSTWRAVANMPTARYGFAAEVVNSKIYIIGGITNSGSTNIVEEYDPAIDQWTQVASMPTERYHISAGEANNKIYVLAGYSSVGGYLDTVEEYTPPQAQNITLDLEADSYNLQLDSQFNVYAKIYGASDIYAEDMSITYNTELFELLDAQIVDQEKLEIFQSNQTSIGLARFIIASKGIENGVNGTEQLLKLSFKVKAIEGEGDISISSGLVADKNGIEIIPKCIGKTFTIEKVTVDVNRDGKISLSDIAIIATLYNTMPEEWGTYQPDINQDGTIEYTDLSTIVQLIFTGKTVIEEDTTAPTILTANIANDNTYIDITFSEGIYGANDGSTPLTIDKLILRFLQNDGGSATGASISSVKKNDNTNEALASVLDGGETIVRVFLSIAGTPNGEETIEITPADSTTIYDKVGNLMLNTQTTGVKNTTGKIIWTYMEDRPQIYNDGVYEIGNLGVRGYYFKDLDTSITSGVFEATVKTVSNDGYHGFNSAMSIRTGDIGITLSIYPNKIEVYTDGFGNPVFQKVMDGYNYHTYRLDKKDNEGKLYVDGLLVTTLVLGNHNAQNLHRVYFGDITSIGGHDVEAYFKDLKVTIVD